MNNSKRRDKFIDLAQKRVNRAIKTIKLIGNLSNRSNYSYSDEDIAKIYRALKKSLDDMKSRFERNEKDEGDVFKL